MARLPQFINTVAPTIGVTPGRVKADPNTGAGFKALGQAVAGIGAEIEAQTTRDENVHFQDAELQYKEYLARDIAERKTNMAPGAEGFVDGFDADATTKLDEIVEARFAGSPRADEIRLRLNKLRIGTLTQAVGVEAKEQQRFTGEVLDNTVKDLQSTVALDHSTYEQAITDWGQTVHDTVGGGIERQTRVLNAGIAKINKAYVGKLAADNPDKFREMFGELAESGPIEKAPPHIHAAAQAAADNDYDPKTLLGLAYIESRWNPRAGKPMRNGKPMSSAEGMFQVLSAKDTLNWLGIKKSDKFNVPVVAAALSRKLNDMKGWMASKGIQTTPGKEYLFWNVGEGAAKAILRADPRTRIEDVIYRVYGSRRLGNELFADVVLRNNPSMYRRGWTVGQVIKNYDRKMSNAMRQADRFYGDSTTEEAVENKLKTFTNDLGYQGVRASDVSEILQTVVTENKKRKKEEFELQNGLDILAGKREARRGNSDDHKFIDKAVEYLPYADNFLDSAQTTGQARSVIKQGKYIPETFASTLEHAILENGTSDQKIRAFSLMADIRQKNRDLFVTTKMKAEAKQDVESFIALTDVEGLGLSPQAAFDRINFERSVEGETNREALDKTLKDETKKISLSDVKGYLGATGYVFDDDAITDVQADVAHNAFKKAYEHHRLKGSSKELALEKAKQDMKSGWGVSETATGAATLMPYPPEKQYSSFDGHNWIREQATNMVAAELFNTGKIKHREDTVVDPLSGRKTKVKSSIFDQVKENYQVKIVPTIQTAEDVRLGKANPRYLIQYKHKEQVYNLGLRSFDEEFQQALFEEKQDRELEKVARASDAQRKLNEEDAADPLRTLTQSSEQFAGP